MPVQGTMPTIPDANRNFTLGALSGTLGDSYGTAVVVPLTATEDGKLRVESSASLSVGTIEKVNNIGTLYNGGTNPSTNWLTMRLTDGTTFYNASGAGGGTSVQIVTGTLGQIQNAGTIQNGTLGVVTTVSNLTNGTVGLVTTVSNLTNGSVRVTTGTINSGTINAGTINSGTINTGTINSGTINAGTFRQDIRPAQTIIPFGTQISGTASNALVAAGVGSSIYVNYLSLVNQGSPDVIAVVGYGTAQQGTNVVWRGKLAYNGGGVALSFDDPVGANFTNTALNAILLSSGTVDLSLGYVQQ